MKELGTYCVRLIVSVMVAGLVLLPAARDANAQGSDVIVTIDEVDTSAFPTMQVRVSVRNRRGVPILDLTAEHLELIEDGAATFQPTDVRTESNPLAQVSLAIVIDMYKTLSGEPIAAAQQATSALLTDLLDQSPDADRAAFVGVHPDLSTDPTQINPEYEVPFTNDRNKLLNVINFLHERMVTSGPGTPMYDAVIKASRLAAATEPVGHRAVIVMTDGEDVGSISTDSDTIQSAVSERTPVFTIGLSNSRLNEQFLKRLADQTGGTFQAAEASDDFSPLFFNVLATLRTQYVLSYESGLPEDGREHSVLMHVQTPTLMEGFHEVRVNTPGTEASPVEQETPASPAPSEPTPVPASSPTPEPVSATTLQGWVTTLQDWVQDNMLVAGLGVAAIALLFLALVIVIIIAIRRRGQAEEEELLLPLEGPSYPGSTPLPFAQTGPDMGIATGRAPASPGGEPPGIGLPQTPSPTVAAGGPPVYGPASVPPFGAPNGPGPVAAQAPFSGPAAQQPPPAAGTRVLSRAPKMSTVGFLIERKHPDNRFDITKPTVVVGRSQRSDVVITHTTVSRQHATIKLEDNQFRLYDMGSSNGTFVGEQRIHAPVTLEDGAAVRFGEVEYIFKIVSLDG